MEEMEGSPTHPLVKKNNGDSPSQVPSPGTAMMPNDSIPGAPMDPVAATMLQRQQQDQQLLETRLRLQQRQVDESLLAAAMATASSNLAGSGQSPSHDARLMQQALMQGRGGMLPYGGFVPPGMITGMPPMLNSMVVAGSQSVKVKKPRKKKPAFDYDDSHVKYKPYFDGSTHPDEDSDSEEDKSPVASKQNEAFPKKLYRMIDEANKNSQDDIISFYPHGRAFGIHKPREFVSDIMPKYLSTTRMSSFQRQLNLYGFRRITEGRDKGGYFHEFFLQGRKGLLKKIKRKKPSVPKSTEEDLEKAARFSHELIASSLSPYGNMMQHPSTLQQLMLLNRGNMLPQGGGMPPMGSFGGPTSPTGQMHPPLGNETAYGEQGAAPAAGSPPM